MAYPGYKGIGPNRIGCSPAKHTGLLTSKAHKKLHEDPNFTHDSVIKKATKKVAKGVNAVGEGVKNAVKDVKEGIKEVKIENNKNK